MEISITDFSAPIGDSVFKFCVHLQEGKLYCVNENLDANPHFAFFFSIFFIFSIPHSYIIHMNIFFCLSVIFFPSKISQQLIGLGF